MAIRKDDRPMRALRPYVIWFLQAIIIVLLGVIVNSQRSEKDATAKRWEVQKVETEKRWREQKDDADSRWQQLQSTLADHAKSIADLKARHADDVRDLSAWRDSWSGYPKDARQLRLELLSDVAEQRAVANGTILNAIKELQNSVRSLELQLARAGTIKTAAAEPRPENGVGNE